jgi:hypothetical protein
MSDYGGLVERLQSLIGDDASDNNIYRQASEAIKVLLAQQQQGCSMELREPDEPTDHEAEGAMRYVMSRGSA